MRRGGLVRDLAHEGLDAAAEFAFVGIAAEVENEVGRAGIALSIELRARRRGIVQFYSTANDDFRIGTSCRAHLRSQIFDQWFKFRRALHRVPSVAELDYAFDRVGAAPTDPDWRSLRMRFENERRKFHQPAVVALGIAIAEQMMQHAQRLGR